MDCSKIGNKVWAESQHSATFQGAYTDRTASDTTCGQALGGPTLVIEGGGKVNAGEVLALKATAKYSTGLVADGECATVSWSSDNSAVAEVDYSGGVYGVAGGTATITGRCYTSVGEISDTHNVTVMDCDEMAYYSDGSMDCGDSDDGGGGGSQCYFITIHWFRSTDGGYTWDYIGDEVVRYCPADQVEIPL